MNSPDPVRTDRASAAAAPAATAPAAAPVASIVVTQRERFGMTAESLESLYAHTPWLADGQAEVIYVDAGSPRRTREYLAREAAGRGFALERERHWLTPNQARNRGLARARGRHVVFVDNDVIYTDGWLEALVDCAEATGAAIVCPLICHALPFHTIIHHAGGDFTEDPDARAAFFEPAPAEGRRFVEIMHGHNDKLADWQAAGRLKRQETGFCEFHVVLARRDVFERIGPLDENMLSTKEHIDFSLAVQAIGEKVWFEPASLVTYVFPNRQRPLEVADWPFFALRWSDSHGRRSLEHFLKKWDLRPGKDYVRGKRAIYTTRRMQAILTPMVRRVPLVSRSRQAVAWCVRGLSLFERQVNRLLVAWHGLRAR